MKPTARMTQAYETGKAAQGKDLTSMMWAGEIDDAFTEGVLGIFFEAGLRGAEMPRWSKGWRYGVAPSCGQSYNYRDDRYEAGVSMMSVEGCDYTPDGTYEMFNGGAQDQVTVEGWLITYKTGSDGEPLLWTNS